MREKIKNKMKNKLNLWVTLGLSLVAIIWGSGFIVTQTAIDEGLSATFIMFIRFTVASIILGITFRKDLKEVKQSDIGMGIMAGTLLFLGFMLQTIGLEFTTPSSNAFITATSVVMVPFFSWVIFKEKPANKTFLAAIVCLGGIGILTLSSGIGFKLSKGDSFTLLCAIAFAMHTVSMGNFAKRVRSNVLTFLQITTAAILSFIMFMIVDRDFSSFLSVRGLLAVLYLAVFSTCVCYSIQTICQKFASPSKVSIIVSTEALIGSIFSVVLGFEPFTYFLLIGGVAVVLSVIIIEVGIPIGNFPYNTSAWCKFPRFIRNR